MLRSLVAGIDHGERGKEEVEAEDDCEEGSQRRNLPHRISKRVRPPPPPPTGSPLPCLAPPQFPHNTHALDWQCLNHARLTAVGKVVGDAGMPQQLTVDVLRRQTGFSSARNIYDAGGGGGGRL